MIDGFEAVDLLHRWYVNYDEGRFDVLEPLVTDDVVFRSRSDTGKHPLEETFRCDVSGAQAALAWTRKHRLESPYPLRHNINNAYVVARRGDEMDLEAYMFVTTVVDGRPFPISTALCTATVREVRGACRLAFKDVVLDTLTSVPLQEIKRVVPR
jgi:SnoaL-like domain